MPASVAQAIRAAKKTPPEGGVFLSG